jgi:NADH dehydrogenase [ubiquinone] 1 alpha subcomplex assembly factor 1
MQGTEEPSRAPLTLFALNTPEAIKDYAYGCDADVGGTSTAFFDFDDDPAHKPPREKNKLPLGAARFHGHMSLAVRPGYEDRVRGGYAGFRNKVRCVGFNPHPPLPPLVGKSQ